MIRIQLTPYTSTRINTPYCSFIKAVANQNGSPINPTIPAFILIFGSCDANRYNEKNPVQVITSWQK